jgi:hypothetical protein
MKIRTYLMAMLLLACSVAMMAQTGMSSDSSMNKSDSMGKSMTMTGCVAEKDGKYMLMNKKHPDGVEMMSSEDMKPHVGHKVTVTGMMHDNATAGDNMKSDNMKSDDKMAKANMGMSSFKVDSMKMVSDHCTMPDSMKK